MVKKYDVIVVGAGAAGLTSALYASRANLSVLLLERGIYGGQMNNTAEIENYPGFKSVMGSDLSQKMYDSCTRFGVNYQFGEVKGIDYSSTKKVVHTDSGDYSAKAIIIATGSYNRHLNVPGEKKYAGKGVSYCAVCDGGFFKGQDLAVVGGGDSAIEEGIYLTQLAKSVTIIVRRDQLRAQKIYQQQAFDNPKIKFMWHSNVTSINGDKNGVNNLDILNNQNGKISKLNVAGIFIYVGIDPLTKPFNNLGITDDKGWIKTDENMQTKLEGIYAAGDVKQKSLRQISTAVGDGGISGQEVYQYVSRLNSKIKEKAKA